MTAHDLQKQGIERAGMHQPEAVDFIWRWSLYCHAIDDIIDEPTTADFRIQTFVQALEIYTHPFFLKHAAALKPLVYVITNQYADSVAWEHSPDEWKRNFSEWARHAGAEMVLAVAQIVGGYQHMRNISLELRTVNFSEHPTETPSPLRGRTTGPQTTGPQNKNQDGGERQFAATPKEEHEDAEIQ